MGDQVEGIDEPVGFVALYGLGRQTGAELGALIGEKPPIRGAGREAERQACARAFDEFAAHKVYGRIPAFNEPAKKAVSWQGGRRRATFASTSGVPTGRWSTARSGASRDRREWRSRSGSGSAELIADGGAAGGRGRVLPLPAVPRRRGSDAHPAGRAVRVAGALPVIVREIPGARAARRDVALRLPGSRDGGRADRPLEGRLVADRPDQPLRPRPGPR